MCLYPRLIENRKYKVNSKNGGNVPIPNDPRVMHVPVGCGECMECRKKRGREWSIRLQEEIRHDNTGVFVTLTFSNESFKKLHEEVKKEENIEGYEIDNAIAKRATRLWLERYRKKHGVSAKHWLITELGHNGTENVHMHGIVFAKREDIEESWQYGFIYMGTYVNERTINYTIKYATKVDEKNPGFKGRILTSKGIGKGYTTRLDGKLNKYKEGGKTREQYTSRQGSKMMMPTYLRNQLYTEEQREKLWLEKLDKQVRYVDGEKIDISKGEEEYYARLAKAQEKSKRLGYGEGELTWEQKQYQKERRNAKIAKRLEKQGIDIKYETENKPAETWEQELQRLQNIMMKRQGKNSTGQ